MEEKTEAPGLRWRNGKPLWRASRAAIAAGYPVKSVNLASLISNPPALAARAARLQAEMRAWLSGRTGNDTVFDGTVGSLLKVYQTDPESTYHKLKPSSRHPYDVYARMLEMEVGARRIDAIDGRDLRRWFTAWSAPDKAGGKPKIAAARMAMTVLKSALTFGKTCRARGCADLKAILEEMQFPAPAARTAAPTATQVIAARQAAHALGHPRAALAYALQFETTARQWDITGQWLPIADPRPSAYLDGKQKWIGPTWAQIDAAMVLRITPTKTEDTSAATVVFDLRLCPMVVEEMARIAAAERSGPLVFNPVTGKPYKQWYFRDLWRRCANAAGIDTAIWNRDLRAGGNTEAQRGGARLEDRKKVMGHSANSQMTADVYDRDHLEAHRRIARARNAYRDTGNE